MDAKWKGAGAAASALLLALAAPVAAVAAPPPMVPAVAAQASACGGRPFSLPREQAAPLPVAGSLPEGTPRPGPDILYWPLADAPQLQNTGPWEADPILVSGASAYRRGEFLYQDFLYDDTGARGTSATGVGTYTYPTEPAYVRNAADLVEVRLKPLGKATGIRLTYNSMVDPALVAATIVLGDAAGLRPLPHGANVQAPAEVFVTVHGTTGDIVDAATGATIGAPTVVVDTERRQVHVCVPYGAFDPRGQRAVRVAVGVGLWDAANGRYLLPGTTATATTPGGAGNLVDPPAFFNAAFRFVEPLSAFRTTRQGTVLRTGDLSEFSTLVDFVKLEDGIDDDMPGQVGGVPQTGYMNRILASHFEDIQGRGTPATQASTLQPDRCPPTGCLAPAFAGQLQPYEIYVPTLAPPPSGYGLYINPHAAGGNHNSYSGGQNQWQVQVGEREIPFISFTANARGTTYWYFGQAGAEVFEIWADIAHRYKLDPTRTLMGGLSMGGYATWKLAGQFPDLFAATTKIVPCASAGVGWSQANQAAPPINQGGAGSMTRLLAPSFRNVPQYIWVGVNDGVCSYWSQVEYANLLDAMGYRYEFYSFPVGHAFPLGNHFQPMVDWMDDRRVERDPHHVTYVLNGMMNEPALGLNADHAYWVSGLALRDGSVSPPVGTIDVFSHGFGIGDAQPTPTEVTTGQMQGAVNPISFTLQARDWAAAPAIPVQNRLDVVASNISAVTIDPARARVDCNATVNVESDGPITVTLAGCP